MTVTIGVCPYLGKEGEPVGSFADVDCAEAVRRAHELIPLLREHGAAMEAATKITPEVLHTFHSSGLFRYQQPRV